MAGEGISGTGSPNGAKALLAKHGFPAAEPVRSPKEGIVNEVWLCGSLVVRICKDKEYEEDCLTEAVAAPAAWLAGVSTPEPLVFDHDRDAAPGLASIFRLAVGQRLSDAAVLASPEQFFFQYGKELALLHHKVQHVHDPSGWLDEPWIIDSSRDVALWKKAESLAAGPVPLVFAHQDLHAENVLVSPNESPIFLDWGDAGWGDGAADFRFIPAQFLRPALAGYGEPPLSLRARIALHQMDQLFYAQEEDEELDYGPWGASSWPELELACEWLLSS